MSLIAYQVVAPTSPSQIKLCDLVPGQTVILSSTATSADVFIGPTGVTAATGAPLDTGGPTTIAFPPSSTPTALYCCAGTGTHVVGVLVVSNG